MNKREDIIIELKRRLSLGFPNIPLIEGTGNIWGLWDKKLPVIHLFELPSSRNLIKPGLYEIDLQVQIEFVNKLNKQDACNTEGRAKIAAMQQTIELDERFTKEKNLKTQGLDLAVRYFCGADEIATPLPNILDSAVLYIFKFTDTFYGYESSKH